MIESEVVAHFVSNRNIRTNDAAHTPLQTKKNNNDNALDSLQKIWIRAAHSSATNFLPNDSFDRSIHSDESSHEHISPEKYFLFLGGISFS